MKTVFFSTPFYSHVKPTVDLVGGLVEVGHEVVYYSSLDLSDLFNDIEIENRDMGQYYEFNKQRTDTSVMKVAYSYSEATTHVLGPLLEATKIDMPDYIITDALCSWGKIIGDMLDIPVVTFFTTPPIKFSSLVSRRIIKQGLKEVGKDVKYIGKIEKNVDKLKADFDLKDLSILNIFGFHTGLNIIASSHYFEPMEDSKDKEYVYIGPPSLTEKEIELDFKIHYDKKLIYISLGTIYNSNIDFYNKCFEAFKDSDYQVVMSIGKSLSVDDLDKVPSNILVENFVPQIEVLKNTDLFITHGGMGSVNESIQLEVPMIVAPQSIEQKRNAKRIYELDAGVRINENKVSAEELKNLVDKVISTESYKENIVKIKNSFIETDGYKSGVDAIQKYVV